MDKESLVVHIQKLLFKKYIKNHKIIFFLNKVEEKKIIEVMSQKPKESIHDTLLMEQKLNY